MNALDFRPALLAWAELQSEEMGHRKCARKGVGGMIRVLRRHIEADVPGILDADMRRTVQMLESFCRLCGKCAKD